MESMVKQFKKSLGLYQQTGLNYAELQSQFKRTAAVLNSRPVSARYGPRHADSDPDYLEILTPNMMLTARSGVDLPSREYTDEYNPGRRLAYKEELERNWWEQWKVQCFDSLLPTKAWHTASRGIKVGDVVLISYTDKSKTGSFRLGIVEKVEMDSDGLIRTCVVSYRLVRCDLPREEMRIYLKGLKFKEIRVPIQRLCVILPVEEQGGSPILKKKQSDVEVSGEAVSEQTGSGEDDASLEVQAGTSDELLVGQGVDGFVDNVKQVKSAENEVNFVEPQGVKNFVCLEDFVEKISVEDQRMLREVCVQNYRLNLMKKQKVQKTSQSVKMLHRNYTNFVETWEEKIGKKM